MSLGGLWVGASAHARARPARFRLLILLCPEWPSARAVGKYHEQTCWDPKDGELCLARMKPEETLVEVRSDSDMQIDRRSWVKGERLIEPSSSWLPPKFPSGKLVLVMEFHPVKRMISLWNHNDLI